ncbi:hypothetical protein Q3G72_034957 [Acer saccharum]|nr:hypothetical protein Q3G72_034957 [Acer saccharum]
MYHSLLYGAEDPSIAGMVLDSPFFDLVELMMELEDTYTIRLPKFTACKPIIVIMKHNEQEDKITRQILLYKNTVGKDKWIITSHDAGMTVICDHTTATTIS